MFMHRIIDQITEWVVVWISRISEKVKNPITQYLSQACMDLLEYRWIDIYNMKYEI